MGIKQIFISHSHLDHICTLPFFTKNIFGHTDVPVEIHALPETLDALRRHLFNDELWPDFSVIPSPDNPIIRFSEIVPGQAYEVEGLRVTPIPVNHLVPCVGYLVEDAKSAFIFSSDTAETDLVYEVANRTANLKLFITEASFPNEQGWLAEAQSPGPRGHLPPHPRRPAGDAAPDRGDRGAKAAHAGPGCLFQLVIVGATEWIVVVPTHGPKW